MCLLIVPISSPFIYVKTYRLKKYIQLFTLDLGPP